MIFLPNRTVQAPEEQQNFEYLSNVISQVRFADALVNTAVAGASTQKLPVEDTQGNLLGYVPIYPE